MPLAILLGCRQIMMRLQEKNQRNYPAAHRIKPGTGNPKQQTPGRLLLLFVIALPARSNRCDSSIVTTQKAGMKTSRWALLIVAIGGLLFLQLILMSQQTLKQRLLQLAYPVLMRITNLAGTNATIRENKEGRQAPVSFYQLQLTRNNGQALPLEQLRGRKVLLVNTASNCGYTGQYEELQQLWLQHQGRLEIIGFPANDFKEQEKGTDADIEQFCKINYGVQFPLAQKSQVVPGPGQHSIFQWLSDAGKNGWNSQAPEWNFAKYLVDEQGKLTHYFGPSVSPLDQQVVKAIGQ